MGSWDQQASQQGSQMPWEQQCKKIYICLFQYKYINILKSRFNWEQNYFKILHLVFFKKLSKWKEFMHLTIQNICKLVEKKNKLNSKKNKIIFQTPLADMFYCYKQNLILIFFFIKQYLKSFTRSSFASQVNVSWLKYI